MREDLWLFLLFSDEHLDMNIPALSTMRGGGLLFATPCVTDDVHVLFVGIAVSEETRLR